MRTRFCATIRRLAFSMMALIAPVILRSVASGLRIEKVRSSAIGYSFTGTDRRDYAVSLATRGRAAYTGVFFGRQGHLLEAPKPPAGAQHVDPLSDVRRLQYLVQ